MAKRSTPETPQRIAERRAQRARELQSIIDRLTGEVAALEAKLAATGDPDDRIAIRAEIDHFAAALDRVQRGPGPGRGPAEADP
jgi:hypothetical protein